MLQRNADIAMGVLSCVCVHLVGVCSQARTLTHAYRVLHHMAKQHTPGKGAATLAVSGGGGAAAVAGAGGSAVPSGPSQEFQDLVSDVHRNLTPVVYNYIVDTAGGQVGGVSASASAPPAHAALLRSHSSTRV